jgi:hypothetical protein
MSIEAFKEEVIRAIRAPATGDYCLTYDNAEHIFEMVEEVIANHTTYRCRATRVHYYQDRNNYPVNREVDWDSLEADTFGELLESMAAYSINSASGEEEKYGNYYRAQFGTIYETLSSVCSDVDLAETKTWKAHEAELAAQKATKEARDAIRAEAARIAVAERLEATEKAEFARLSAKYGETK